MGQKAAKMKRRGQDAPSSMERRSSISWIFSLQTGLNFALCSEEEEDRLMNPSRILGGIALAVGGGLLLSELFIGPDLLTEMTGAPMAMLWLLCSLIFFLGVLAVGLSIRDAREFTRDDQGVHR